MLIALTLGGSVATTTVPGSFLPLQNPANVSAQYDLSGLAQYYNSTLARIGEGNYANASFLLSTFRFVNIPPSVNVTAQAANSDLGGLNTTIPKAQELLAKAELAIQARQLINATRLVDTGCALATDANRSLADFGGSVTAKFQSESVPTSQYAPGEALVASGIEKLHGECTSILAQIPGPMGTPIVLTIGSTQKAIQTGGSVGLLGNLTRSGVGVAGQKTLFYINGSYFGTLVSDSSGNFAGTLPIPFVYFQRGVVQALVAPNSTVNLGGATSNPIYFTILFNQTSIVIGDPPAYLPGTSFKVHGILTTTSGVPLPNAPVIVTYLRESANTTTDGLGRFGAQFTVPDNATDGIYFVYAHFAARGVFGPSFNFTSIEVYHLRLSLVLSVPGLSLAGFSTHIGGTATSNGSAVADATIDIVSPWGSATTKTDGSGNFDVSVPVSPLEFALSKNVAVSAVPSEPYIGSSTIVATLGLFNILLVVLPAVIIGVGAFEANSLGVFRGIRERTRRGRGQGPALEAPVPRTLPEISLTYAGGPEPLSLFGRAATLASRRFSIAFQPSHTIREMLLMVKAKDDGESFVMFSNILLMAEDFLYGSGFDPSRTDEARRALTSLETVWG